jgi:Domain of unknown function (DUF4234)
MAYEVSAGGANVKIRSPWAPIGLGIITLGIYDAVWYYKINREMRDFGAVSNDRALAATNPVASVLAVTLGALILIPPFVSYVNTVSRLQRVERLRSKDPISWGLIIVLFLASIVTFGLVGLAIPYIIQQHLNGVWLDYDPNPSAHQVPGQPPAVLDQTPVAPAPGPPAAAPQPDAPGPSAPPPPPQTQ